MFTSHIFGKPTVVLVGSQALRFALGAGRSHFSVKEAWPPAIAAMIGDSLLTQDGPEHSHYRRVLAPAFHASAVGAFAPALEQTVISYLDKWERQSKISWYAEFKQLTFDNACRFLFGASPDARTASLSSLFTVVSDGMSPLIPVQVPFTPFRRGLRARDVLLRHIDSMVAERRENPGDDAISQMVTASGDETGGGASSYGLARQSLMLLYAGHESTASLLTLLFLELSRHPQVLRRARDEQLAVLAHEPVGQPIWPTAIEKMPYLNQVLLEVERLHPPFTGVFRQVTDGFEYNGYHIPRGWRALFSIGATHRLDTAFRCPADFNPDRFAETGRLSGAGAGGLITFGAGARTCLGMEFARLQARVTAAHMLRRLHWELAPGQNLTLKPLPTPVPKDGLRVVVREPAGPSQVG